MAVARSVAAHRGPLRARATPRERERDATLRHELLGATELWLDLEREPADEGPARSRELAAAYVRRIGVATLDLDPRLGAHRPKLWSRLLAATLAVAGLTTLMSTAWGQQALLITLAGADARPPPPPQDVWTRLELELDYPDYTQRAPRVVPNPSGALRIPAGTEVRLTMDLEEPAEHVRVVFVPDSVELAAAPEPEFIELAPLEPDPKPEAEVEEALRWTGSFTFRGAGSWIAVLLDDPDTPLARAARRSPPMRLELEPDGPPEVELLPLPEAQREASETQAVDLRFSARDDFGVVQAELVYEIDGEDGSVEGGRVRLPAGTAPGGAARRWQHRHRWDLSTIPIEDRSEVSYWIEVRDNDPGLGRTPLDDGPGKVASSARQRLLVRDDEAEHAANIRDLQTIRDGAVDLLAVRLTTKVFDEPTSDATNRLIQLPARLDRARRIHLASAELLTMLADAVDALAVDAMVAERDVETLAGIHARLLELHREELALHEELPVGSEFDEGGVRKAHKLLAKLGRHNKKEVEALEDEIIRLDDLVDGQIIERMEALVARLQASQQKLVDKLEQLAAGDESVRPEIEQLEQRIREDTRRLQQAQAQLSKEVGEEWMNLDAYKAMEARMRSQQLLEQLQRGDVEGALEQARDGLDAIRQLREQVQRSGAEAPSPALSEEDRKRMKLLRELSRLQDEEAGVRAEAQKLHEQWRASVGDQRAETDATERAKQEAEKLREEVEAVNDARLSREGRTAWEDAREALDALDAAPEDADGQAGQLELFEAAQRANEALRRAKAGAEGDEAKALDELAKRAARLQTELRGELPDPEDTLPPESTEQFEALSERQETLRERSRELLDDPAADLLPDAGEAAMRSADEGMQRAGQGLDDAALDDALDGASRAWQGLQRAIDSLRQSSPPPPQSSGGESSTEADRDRSLRDQVVEAMREGDRDDFDADTKRYYEELLR
ncbi:hypothetical protein PPSIR1_12918 [Plesiocystis pacifica SIR-1]|uniref:DUF4175 domain-containing protein n=1 Tax=Plesiocystis pacifica SIR-1 TaxID=391625 RepID=A6G088_9BACT|nr:DUF4175 family protein [Plesiocystis pacifica]EDM80785.1 hypothetical protein PPSIR1_12918 [Plesiocystis pacifica SIR-1]